MSWILSVSTKAKVFISCGQKRDSDERSTAEAVALVLGSMGFEPYIAFVEQTLNGLKENIFSHLENSEYLLFIDYKRDLLAGMSHNRGSLFSNQELAIASYLKLPALVLQEQGVLPFDGMMGVFQANAHGFFDRTDLPELVGKLVRTKIETGEWSPLWKNRLSIEIPEKKPSVAQSRDIFGKPTVYAFYHLAVKNMHRSRTALNCCVFLESAADVKTQKRLPFQTVEFKWAGTTLPAVMIAPGTSRMLDAFKKPCMLKMGDTVLAGILDDSPLLEVIEFTTFSDSTEFLPRIINAGVFDLTYGIYSSNFPLSRTTIRIENGRKPAEVKITQIT